MNKILMAEELMGSYGMFDDNVNIEIGMLVSQDIIDMCDKNGVIEDSEGYCLLIVNGKIAGINNW